MPPIWLRAPPAQGDVVDLLDSIVADAVITLIQRPAEQASRQLGCPKNLVEKLPGGWRIDMIFG